MPANAVAGSVSSPRPIPTSLSQVNRVGNAPALTCAAIASRLDPGGSHCYVGVRSTINARSTVPRETPNSRAISRFECCPLECRRRIFAHSSILITFHTGWWPCFQSALMALFSVGVNTCPVAQRVTSESIYRVAPRTPTRSAAVKPWRATRSRSE